MIKKIGVLLAVLLVAGCATGRIPQADLTPTQRYVQADGNFKALLLTIQQEAFAGRITVEQAKEIKPLIATLKIAMDTWGLAPDNVNAETTAILALSAVQQVLAKLGPQAGLTETEKTDLIEAVISEFFKADVNQSKGYALWV